MWEISLNIKSENKQIADKINFSLKEYLDIIGGFVTLHEENEYIRVLIGVDEDKEEMTKMAITSCVIDIICNDFKLKYLNDYLFLPSQDKIGMYAFKKALLNFDKETDKFIIKKNLVLEKDLFLESFYHFKLKTLQNKWSELVALSNENRDYLLTNESFIDLLKFLVDNLDICEDEISIVKEGGGYRIYTDEEKLLTDGLLNEESVVSSVIDLSPQRINLYFNESSSAIDLLEQIFEERITIKKSCFNNIKKFELN